MKKNISISHEAIDRYIKGKSSLEEISIISLAIKENEAFRSMINILENLHKKGFLYENSAPLPVDNMAALSEGNLCDVLCEQYILRDYQDTEVAEEGCLKDALMNSWLNESGMPLHNMGRLLEHHGLSVSRKFDCSVDELKEILSNRFKVIAVVDYGQLWEKEADGVFHAVVCVNIINGIIRIYDPAIDGHSNYPMEEFERAWNYSRKYLVYASAKGLDYNPHPIDVSEVDLDDDLIELTECIAENAHEIWAFKRKAEGWKYGPQRDDRLLLHPDMVPYCELTEGEKYYDRDMALNTIRLVKKLGYDITRRLTAYCPVCGEFVSSKMHFCPNCGNPLHDCLEG